MDNFSKKESNFLLRHSILYHLKSAFGIRFRDRKLMSDFSPDECVRGSPRKLRWPCNTAQSSHGRRTRGAAGWQGWPTCTKSLEHTSQVSFLYRQWQWKWQWQNAVNCHDFFRFCPHISCIRGSTSHRQDQPRNGSETGWFAFVRVQLRIVGKNR